MQNKIEYWLFSLVGLTVRLMPLKVAQSFAKTLAFVVFHLTPIRKKVTIDNLKRAFPEKNHSEINRIAYGSYKNFVTTIVELLWFPRFTDKKLRETVKIRNIELLYEELKKEKGAILMSAHFGNWELVAMAIGRMSGHPVTIVVQGMRNPYVGKLVNDYRCRYGNRVVDMSIAVREIIRALNEKKVVAMLGDQSAGPEGAFIEYFGIPASTYLGPAVFSLKTRAPLIVGIVIRQKDGTYEVIGEAVDKTGIEEFSEQNAIELTRRHVAILEKYVRLYPDHWLWQHRRWKHTPKDTTRQQEN
jgi:KDO2-lipid IV(A) lauroyltransferase